MKPVADARHATRSPALPEIIGSTAQLVVIDVPMLIPVRSLWVGYHQDLRRSERVSRFVQFLCQEMQPRSVGR